MYKQFPVSPNYFKVKQITVQGHQRNTCLLFSLNLRGNFLNYLKFFFCENKLVFGESKLNFSANCLPNLKKFFFLQIANLVLVFAHEKTF